MCARPAGPHARARWASHRTHCKLVCRDREEVPACQQQMHNMHQRSLPARSRPIPFPPTDTVVLATCRAGWTAPHRQPPLPSTQPLALPDCAYVTQPAPGARQYQAINRSISLDFGFGGQAGHQPATQPTGDGRTQAVQPHNSTALSGHGAQQASPHAARPQLHSSSRAVGPARAMRAPRRRSGRESVHRAGDQGGVCLCAGNRCQPGARIRLDGLRCRGEVRALDGRRM